MAKIQDDFFELAEMRFGWLASHGFKSLQREAVDADSSLFYCSILWSNTQMFVQAILEFPRPYLDVQFGMLVRGVIPESDDIDHRYHLSQLVAISGDAKLARSSGTLRGLRRSQLDEALKKSSELLQQLASGLFAGDLSKLRDLKAYAHFVMEQSRQTYLGE